MRTLTLTLVLICCLSTSNAQDIPLQITKLYPDIKISEPLRNDIVDMDPPEEYFVIAEKRELRDEMLEALVERDSFEFERLDNGDILETLRLSEANGEWINSSLTTNTYNDNNQLIQSLRENWTGTDWMNAGLDTYMYENDNPTLVLRQTWFEEEWKSYYRESLSYFDGTNLLDTVLIQDDWYMPLELNNSRLNNYTSYDQNGRLLEWYTTYWDPYEMAWINPNRYQYTYNAEGYPILYQAADWIEDMWVTDRQSIYTYNADDLLLSTLSQSWDEEEQDWVSTGLSEREYDEDGNITLYQVSRYNEETGSMEIYYRVFLSYDEEGRRTSVLEQTTFVTEELVDYFLVEYTYYDDIGELWTVLYQEKDLEEDVWIETSRYIYYYDLFVDTEDLLLTEEKVSITPNPGTDVVQISFEREILPRQGLTAELINAMGRVEQQFVIRQSSHQLDVSNLAAGVYWLRFGIGQQSFTKQIVVL